MVMGKGRGSGPPPPPRPIYLLVALVEEPPMPSEREIRVPEPRVPSSVMKIYGIKGNLFPDRFVVHVAADVLCERDSGCSFVCSPRGRWEIACKVEECLLVPGVGSIRSRILDQQRFSGGPECTFNRFVSLRSTIPRDTS